MDSETGLYYLRARYYDTYTGRFISEDSYWGEDKNPLSLNLYTYCENDPIMFTDPSGHSVLKGIGNIVKKAVEAAKAAKTASSSGSSNSGGSSSSNSSSGSSNSNSNKKDTVTVTWEGYIETIDRSELAKYESRAWHVFNGKTYTDKTYIGAGANVDFISTSGNSTIYNNGTIGTIKTGDNSNTTINNRGFIDTINTGKDSSLVLDNSGTINKINIGESSSAIILNYGKIEGLETNAKNYISFGNGDYFIGEDGFANDLNTFYDLINRNIANPNGFMLLASKSNSSEITKWSVTKNFFSGFADAGKSALDSLKNIFSHPINTGKNLVEGLGFLYNASKLGTEENILLSLILGQAMEQVWNDFKEGNDNKKAEMIGRVVGEIAFVVVGTKGVDKALKGIKALTKTGQFTKILSKIGKGTMKVDDAVIIVEEAAETVSKLSEKVSDIRKLYKLVGGNVGVADINVTGFTGEIKAFSKYGNFKNPNIVDGFATEFINGKFKTLKVNGRGEIDGVGSWARSVDTESKILESIASKLGDNYAASGTIDLFTELPPCISCKGVIEQFEKMYPKIKVNIFNN